MDWNSNLKWGISIQCFWRCPRQVRLRPLDCDVECFDSDMKITNDVYFQRLIDLVGDIRRSIMVYYIVVGFLSRVLPIIILLITTLILIVLLHCERIASFGSSDIKQMKQLKRINKLVLTILIVFLIVEIQDGIALLIYVYELVKEQNGKIMSEKTDLLWYTISSTLSLLSYDCLFWIHFLISTQFRRALWSMLYCCNKRPRDVHVLQLESRNVEANTSIYLTWQVAIQESPKFSDSKWERYNYEI